MGRKVSDRQNKILNIIKEKRKAEFRELAQLFEVHEMTIRRDCEFLERQGFILRTPKGIHAIPRDTMKTIGENELKENEEGRRSIARYVVKELIKNNDSVFLGPGIISLFILEEIESKKWNKHIEQLSIYTNSYEHLGYAFSHYNPIFRIFSSGGELNPISNCFYGNIALERMNSWAIDKIFVEANAISLEFDQSLINNTFEVSIVPAFLAEKSNIYLLADHLSFNKLAVFPLIQLTKVQAIITDSIESEIRNEIDGLGVQVFEASFSI